MTSNVKKWYNTKHNEAVYPFVKRTVLRHMFSAYICRNGECSFLKHNATKKGVKI